MLRLISSTDLAKRQKSEFGFNQSVGAKLRAERERQKITLETMGGKLDIHATQVMRHESGATPLTCVRAARICQILGIDMRELFT